jgi:hypothetical protein
MKKAMVIILACLLMAGCSPKNVPASNTQAANGAGQQTSTNAVQEPVVSAEAKEEGWYAGAIGNSKVHARFDISGDKVSGVYYYDKYKKNIEFSGYLEKQIKDIQRIDLTEKTDKQGAIYAIFRSPDYIQGVWVSGNARYPMYLIREGASQTPPTQTGEQAAKLAGHWNGKGSGYFGGSEADITVLSDDLIFYELSAFNGANLGTLQSFAIVKDGIGTTIFEDKTYDEKKENVRFQFSLKDGSLMLDSNAYDYGCGMGVSFDKAYTKEEISVSMPTALDIGIVDTKEQDELFKKIVGDSYGAFISYTAGVSYTEDTMDGKKVKYGESLLRGASGYCFYIISDESIYAAIFVDDNLAYFTNDKAYSNKLPKPLEDWLKSKGNNPESAKIIYNYKELQ